MNLLDKLERPLGRFAIPHVMRYVVSLTTLVFLLSLTNPGYSNLLVLDRNAILNGEVWRLFTWIFVPPSFGSAWLLFYLMFMWFTWWVGDSLEVLWGTFRLNVYYAIGVIGCTLAAFLFGTSGGNYLLLLSLLLALATMTPNQEVLLLIFPVKLKWVALLSLAFPWGLLFVTAPFGVKAMILVCLGNYLLFFGPQMLKLFRDGRRTPAILRRPDPTPLESLHRCQTCGLTEVADPNADFRVAGDGHEYCLKHLPRN
jgi:hypothetical protein